MLSMYACKPNCRQSTQFSRLQMHTFGQSLSLGALNTFKSADQPCVMPDPEWTQSSNIRHMPLRITSVVVERQQEQQAWGCIDGRARYIN